MKSTELFKQTIKTYLDKRAETDSLFAVAYGKQGKNLDDCVTCILNTVQKSGCNGFAEEEVYGMAVHYYDEDNIEVGKPVDCTVVVNHAVTLTDEEKAQAHEDAMQKAREEAYAKLTHSTAQSRKKTAVVADAKPEMPTLF